MTPQKHVLVVDDNSDHAITLAALLRSLGHKVWTARNGKMALVVAAETKPDLVLVDIVMPEMDGFELARQLRDMSGLAHSRIVAMSGYGWEIVKGADALEVFHSFLEKPISKGALSALLDDAQNKTLH